MGIILASNIKAGTKHLPSKQTSSKAPRPSHLSLTSDNFRNLLWFAWTSRNKAGKKKKKFFHPLFHTKYSGCASVKKYLNYSGSRHGLGTFDGDCSSTKRSQDTSRQAWRFNKPPIKAQRSKKGTKHLCAVLHLPDTLTTAKQCIRNHNAVVCTSRWQTTVVVASGLHFPQVKHATQCFVN